MKKKTPHGLGVRIADAKQRMVNAIESGAPSTKLEPLVKELEVLRGLARLRWRRRLTVWLAGAAAVALIVSLPLQFWLHLESADVVLVANTRAFIFVNGPVTSNLLVAGGVPAREIVTNKKSIARTDLQLITLILNAKSTARLRVNGPCVEMSVLRGGGHVDFAWRAPESDSDFADLGPNDFVRFCTASIPLLQAKEIGSIIIGDQTEGSTPAEREDVPSLLQGTLTILNTAETIDLRRTDIPRASALTGGTLVARLRDSIEITVVGNAKRISVGTGALEETRMPSWLDWLRRSPAFKMALAVIGAIFAAAIATREHLLREIE